MLCNILLFKIETVNLSAKGDEKGCKLHIEVCVTMGAVNTSRASVSGWCLEIKVWELGDGLRAMVLQ